MIDEVGYAPQMIMSHLACADQPQHEKNRTQLALFSSVIAQFPAHSRLARQFGRRPMTQPRHALPDGAARHRALWRPRRQRPAQPDAAGGDARGADPADHATPRPASSVGYGATYTLTPRQPHRDGRHRLCRRLPALAVSGTNQHAGGRAFVRGKLVPVVGRVSMDMFAIDITDLGNDIPLPGEMVEILGNNVSVDDQADPAGTIGYEILTSLKGRYSADLCELGGVSVVGAADAANRAECLD